MSFLASLDPLVEIKGKGDEEKKHLLAYEDGRFTCVSVPTDYLGSLCFDNHEEVNAFSDSESKLCCAEETGHVHAHIHRGDAREEILLEQCSRDALCVPPPIENLSKCSPERNHQGEGHEHSIECGHGRISHGDHYDWLLPMPDGSFLVQHSHDSDDGGSHYHENGRLIKVGAARASLRKRRPHKVDIFDYRMPSHNESNSRFLLRTHHSPSSSPVVIASSWEEVIEEDVSSVKTSRTHEEVKSLYLESMKPNLSQENLRRTVLDVLGICCPSEVPLIRRILEPLPGVSEVSVNVISKTTTVIHDPVITSELILVKALNEASLEASLHIRGKGASVKRWPSPWVLICGLLLVVAFFKYLYEPLRFVALGAVAVGIPKIALKSLGALRRYVMDINTLMILAVIGAIALGDYLEAATVVLLFSIAEWLESRSTERARLALESVFNMSPETATLFETGLRVPTEEVEVGTYLAVKSGETIPIDGKVVEGNGAVDESSLTGESVAVSKSPGMEVWAGTINTAGFMKIQTTAQASDSAVSRMARLVEDAQSQRSRSELFIESFAKYYTPIVICLAVLMIVIPLALHASNARHWVYLALVLLVVACPCALVISTPVTVVCGVAQAARRGLIIKGGEHLETLAKVKIVAFDKTGTLTQGRFQVAHFLPLTGDDNGKQILYWIASVENLSSHPLAPAVVSYARIRGVGTSSSVLEFEILPGEGISAQVDGHIVQIGNSRMMERLRLFSDLDNSIPKSWEVEGGTVSYVAADGRLVAMFSVADSARPEAAEAVQALRASGLRVAMLTGDNQGSAEAIRSAIDPAIEVYAQLLPEDKVSIVADLKSQGTVAMIGDGINDAPALASSDVGIAMGVAGSAMAMETADVSLMQNDLRQISRAILLARKCRIKMIQNVGFSLFTKAVVIVLSAVGYASLWLALLADVGTCLLVVFNSLLVLDKKTKGKNNKGKQVCVSDSLGLSSEVGEKTCCQNEAGQNSCCEDLSAGDECKAQDGGCCKEEVSGHGKEDACGGHSHGHSHSHGRGLSAIVKRMKKVFHHHGHGHDHGHDHGHNHGHEHGHGHRHGSKKNRSKSACKSKGGNQEGGCCAGEKEVKGCCATGSACGKQNKTESCCGDKHDHEHEHGHGHEHDHEHGHGHKHDHEHGHGHKHDHEHGDGHKHDHEHGDGHKHDHEHGDEHKHGHDHKHPHGVFVDIHDVDDVAVPTTVPPIRTTVHRLDLDEVE